MTKTVSAEDPKIQELREKIKDEGYIQGAILRLALIMSNRLIEVKEQTDERLL